jgi:xanthine dehydrogenase small subunit
MALGAALVLRRGTSRRTLPLEAFYVDYMKNVLEPGEFLEALEVPLPSPDASFRAYKLSKRFDCDISAVAAGLSITRVGDTVTEARFAFGGMAAIVRRAAQAEAAVVGKAWDEVTLEAAIEALASDFAPLTDMRASASYRLRSAQNLLRRFWMETRQEEPLGSHQVSVWSVMPHAMASA